MILVRGSFDIKIFCFREWQLVKRVDDSRSEIFVLNDHLS